MSASILPADVYDALAASAEKYSGIGRGLVGEISRPCCVLGHAEMVDHETPYRADENGNYYNGPTVTALQIALGADGWCDVGAINDDAVTRICRRRGEPFATRVTFAEWCAEIGVERGS